MELHQSCSSARKELKVYIPRRHNDSTYRLLSGKSCVIPRATDGRIIHCAAVSLARCQLVATSEIVKALLVLSPSRVRSAIASIELYLDAHSAPWPVKKMREEGGKKLLFSTDSWPAEKITSTGFQTQKQSNTTHSRIRSECTMPHHPSCLQTNRDPATDFGPLHRLGPYRYSCSARPDELCKSVHPTTSRQPRGFASRSAFIRTDAISHVNVPTLCGRLRSNTITSE